MSSENQSAPHRSGETANPRYKKAIAPMKPKKAPKPKAKRPVSVGSDAGAKLKDKVTSVFKKVQDAMSQQEKSQRIQNRQSKRFRPVLPSLEEIESENPLYKSFMEYDSGTKKLPTYSMRKSTKKKDKSELKASFRVASLESKGFADHASETKKDFNNYYFSPLTMTDDEVFEAVVGMIMLHVNEDVLIFSNTAVLEQVADFVRTVRDGYTETSYHNFRHAADVMQMMYLLVTNHLGVGTTFALDSTQPFLLLVIALCHDMGHFGANNSFLRESAEHMKQNASRERSKRESTGEMHSDYVDAYGEESTLEKFHVAKASLLIQNHRLFSSEFMRSEVRETLLDLLEYLVLWTDMDRHQDFMKEYLEEVQSNKSSFGRTKAPLTPQSTKERQTKLGLLGLQRRRKKKRMPKIYLAMTLKLADISNVTRSFDDSQEWAKLLNIEFSAMGRIESENPNELIEFQKQLTTEQDMVDMARFTLNFMSAISVPLAQSFTAVTKSGSWHMLNEMLQNMQIWLSIIDDKSGR